MPRQMIIHFDPPGGGSAVAGEVFVKSLEAIVEGFKSLSNALAPAMAESRSWSRAQVRDVLTVGFCAVREGSLRIQVAHGFDPGPSHIDAMWISKIGWRATTMAINGAARGKIAVAEVPVVAAQHFVRAARIARESNVALSLKSSDTGSRQPDKWRTDVDLTGIEPALAKYVERRSVVEITTTQLVGKITSLDYDPPSFVLETGRGKMRVAMRASLRTKAHNNWGQEVVVVAEAKMTADGKISEPAAIDILGAASSATEDDEEAGFGLFKDGLDSEKARSYFESLRGRN